MTSPPTLAEFTRYVSADTIDPEDVALALNAAIEAQAARCVTVPYTWSLYLAAVRRASRILTAKGAPLQVLDLGALGSAPISRWDAIIEEEEADARKGPFA